MPEAKGSPWRSKLFRKHALQGVQNLTSIPTLWSHRITYLLHGGGDNIQPPKGARGYPWIYQPISILLQGAKADLSPSSKCSASSREQCLFSVATQRRQGDLVIKCPRADTGQEDLGMFIWGHQMLMAGFWLLPTSHSSQSTFPRDFPCSPLSSPRSLTCRRFLRSPCRTPSSGQPGL